MFAFNYKVEETLVACNRILKVYLSWYFIIWHSVDMLLFDTAWCVIIWPDVELLLFDAAWCVIIWYDVELLLHDILIMILSKTMDWMMLKCLQVEIDPSTFHNNTGRAISSVLSAKSRLQEGDTVHKYCGKFHHCARYKIW